MVLTSPVSTGDFLKHQIKTMAIKKLRSLKQGTRFIHNGKDDVKFIAIARTKRGSHRDVEFEGREGISSMRCDDTVEVIEASN